MNECARMNCDKTAVALLTFAPQQAKAWLYDLDQPDPNGGIMLCRHHANKTVVPVSWQLVDARDPAWPGEESAPAPEPVPAAATDTAPAAVPSVAHPYGVTQPAGVLTPAEVGAHRSDMSLFELPLSDLPAVTPHPDFS